MCIPPQKTVLKEGKYWLLIPSRHRNIYRLSRCKDVGFLHTCWNKTCSSSLLSCNWLIFSEHRNTCLTEWWLLPFNCIMDCYCHAHGWSRLSLWLSNKTLPRSKWSCWSSLFPGKTSWRKPMREAGSSMRTWWRSGKRDVEASQALPLSVQSPGTDLVWKPNVTTVRESGNKGRMISVIYWNGKASTGSSGLKAKTKHH